MLAARLDHVARTCAPGTARNHGVALLLFERFLRERDRLGPTDPIPPEVLSQRSIEEFHAWRRRTPGRGTAGAAVATANRHARMVEAAWRWAADREEWEGVVPRPRLAGLHLPTPRVHRVVAPTWAEMDACIAACQGWHRHLAIVLRFTGLRVQQAMRLRWTDLDLDRAVLAIRPELGKTRAESQGRDLPVSPHLIAEVRSWPRVGPWLVVSGRPGQRARLARARDMERAWRRAGVRAAVWEGEEGSHGRAHNAFRKGFQSEMTRAGVADEPLDHLVGHQGRTVRSRHYLDPDVLPLRQAVARIPPLDPAPRLGYAPDIPIPRIGRPPKARGE